MEAGSDAFLSKPYHPDEVFGCLAKHLGARFVFSKKEAKALKANSALPVLTPEALATLPEDLRQELHGAALLLHPETVNKAIDHIRATHPELAKGLAALASEFHYDQILKLLKPLPHTTA